MLPNDAISTPPVLAAYLSPDGERTDALEDYEQGGVGLQDTSAGLGAYRWRGWFSGGAVYLQRDGLAAALIDTPADVVEFAFAFDQSMRPVTAYQTSGGTLLLRYYDTLALAYATVSFGAGRNPRLTLDDKRLSQSSSSDVIFAYARDGGVYYRQQRDRYLTERLVASSSDGDLVLRNIGMTENLRLKFDIA